MNIAHANDLPLVIDASALNKQADMQREAFSVPGLHAYPEQSVSVRKAALV